MLEQILKLNKNQQDAVKNVDGPILVIAGAGTGKTSVLTTRIAHLIKDYAVHPSSILAFTFTNKAAGEMNSRISTIVDGCYLPWIGTYHGICLKILKHDIARLGMNTNFSVIDEGDKISIIKSIIRENEISYKQVTPKKYAQIISKIKNNNINLNSLTPKEILELFDLVDMGAVSITKFIYKQYKKWLLKINALDFDDLILLAHKLLDNDLEIRTKWQSNFKYILVDEFQDTNLKQLELINFLVNPSFNNIFAVGDPNQTIYTWRGAYPNIFNDFLDHYIQSKIIKLNQNYRSNKNIVNVANVLISKNTLAFKNDLVANNKNNNPVEVFFGSGSHSQGHYLVNKIATLTSKNNVKYSGILILYRANYVSRSIEEHLIKANIPYTIYGGIKFYQRAEIKDILSYLKSVFLNDDVSLIRIINTPRRKISDSTIDEVMKFANINDIGFYDSLLRANEISTISSTARNSIAAFLKLLSDMRQKLDDAQPSEYIDSIMKWIKYEDYLKTFDLSYESKLENIKELCSSFNRFLASNPDKEMIDFLNEISLFSSIDEMGTSGGDCITLMTVHMAKGLEFDTVFVFEMSEGIFPSEKSQSQNEIEEERRTAYVAITRAINNLFITCSSSFNTFRKTAPSRFIQEMGIGNFIEARPTIENASHYQMGWFNSKVKTNLDLKKVYSSSSIKYNVGDRIAHTIFGEGLVVSVKENDMIDVTFKSPHGRKTLLGTHHLIKRIIK